MVARLEHRLLATKPPLHLRAAVGLGDCCQFLLHPHQGTGLVDARRLVLRVLDQPICIANPECCLLVGRTAAEVGNNVLCASALRRVATFAYGVDRPDMRACSAFAA